MQRPPAIIFVRRPRAWRAFVVEVESAINGIREAPSRWRVIEQPDIRRYVLRRFPYVVYYRWELEPERITIYAVMHCSREPGYWKHRAR